MQPKILIIDDDVRLIALLKEYLTPHGYQVAEVTHPSTGLDYLASGETDLVILDVMLPDLNGFETLKAIRKQSEVPVIMLTARGEVTDRIVGLELGADDYLPKPFEPRELLVRINTVLKRAREAPTSDTQYYGDLKIDPLGRNAWLNDTELELSTAEFDVLNLLVSKAGRTLNRDQITDELKGQDWATFQRSVDVLISRLRQKLGDDAKKPLYIKTIWGTGYRFIQKRGRK